MKTKLSLLSILFVTLFISSVLFVGVGLTSEPQRSLSAQQDGATQAGYPATDLVTRNSPVSILVYSQFADLVSVAPHNEFRNTIDSIKSTYGEQFQYENLTSYTQLSTELSKIDIFLIPEQENLYSANLSAIVSAWSGPLFDFVHGGGIVIALDCYSTNLGRAGPTMSILNGTGLMAVNNPVSGLAWTNNLVNQSNALARGVASSYSAPDGSVYFDTTDGTTVIADGLHSVVVDKIVGTGHVVLLGFDIYTRESNSDTLLANAIRLHRHVVFDQSHDQLNSITSGYENFALDLASKGFAVSSMSSFDKDILDTAAILVIGACDYHGTAVYTLQELNWIDEFVSAGGGLLIFSDGGSYGNVTDTVSERFGFVRNKSLGIYDTDDYNPAGSGYSVIYSGAENINNHSATLTVSTIETWWGVGLESYPAGTFPLIVTDSDGTASLGLTKVVNGMPFAAAVDHNLGRIIFIGDSDMFSDSDTDSDTVVNYYDMDAELFAENCIRWLSAAGITDQTVLFDASHGYNYFITLSYYGFATLLTENGYTLRWMSTFYESLIVQCDILIVEDGNTDYTTQEVDSIENFVNNGGSLFLIGGSTTSGEQTDQIGTRFGMDLNNTGNLEDSDDSIGPAGYIVYNTSNFATHPIMQGITRFESYLATAFVSIGGGTSLITTDGDGTCMWSGGGLANSVSILAAKLSNKGRIVYFADYRFLTYNQDTDGDGFNNLYDGDNSLLVLNILHWLAENRAPTVEVTFPNGGEVLNGTQTITWDFQDFDNDAVTFDIYLSNNSGSTWALLVSGLTINHYDWNTTQQDDGSSYRVRVIVSDGILSNQDDSDGSFELDNFADTVIGSDLLLLIAAVIGAAVVLLILAYFLNKRRAGGSTPPPKKKPGTKKN
jgi:uncharacterized membrane protein